MGIARRWLVRVAVALLSAYLCLLGGLAAFIQFYQPPNELSLHMSVVVLSAGQRPDGTMGRFTAMRLAAGVEAYGKTGGGPFVVTGSVNPDRSLAHEMAAAALQQGVLASAIVTEPNANSTLQNALFTADLIGTSQPIVLVTNRFHLPRAWASFWWAGFRDITLYPADTPQQHWKRRGSIRRVFSEVSKFVYNAKRVLGAALPASSS